MGEHHAVILLRERQGWRWLRFGARADARLPTAARGRGVALRRTLRSRAWLFGIRFGGRRLSAVGRDGSIGQTLDSLTKQIGKTTLRKLVDDTVELVERHYIHAALELTGGNRTAAAELLGLSRQSLYVKLGRYDIDGDDKAESSR